MSLAQKIGTILSAVTATGANLRQALDFATPVALASAATVNIGTAASNRVSITGTTTIVAFDSIAAGAVRTVTFAGAVLLTYNVTSLILPGGANITTSAGDVAEFESLGGGNWRCTNFQSVTLPFSVPGYDVQFFKQNAPVAKTAAATLTAAEILNGVITFSGTAANLTMPLGSDLDAAIIGGNLPFDTAFDFSVVTLTGSGTASLVGNTGVTILAGFQTVALATSTFRVRKTGANTFSVYKV